MSRVLDDILTKPGRAAEGVRHRLPRWPTAILDRLFHKARIFNIDGHSYRLKDFNQALKGAPLE